VADKNPDTESQENSTQAQGGSSSDVNEETVPEMSLEDVDLFIADVDPAFAAQLKEIGQDKDLTIEEPQLSESEMEFLREKEKWDRAKGFRRLVYRILPSVVQLSLRLQKLKFQIYSKAQAEKIRFVNWLIVKKENIKEGGIRSRNWLQDRTIGRIREGFRIFNSFDRKKKIVLSVSAVATLGAISILILSWTRGLIPSEKDLFLFSLDTLADKTYLTQESEDEPFYENIRTGLHLFHIEKIVVNIRASSQSGANPMAAFDFFIEANSPEVLAEIKLREVPLRDQFQRTIEQYTFDQLDTVDGKKELTQTLERELNAVLTAGRIRAVRIKTAILKP
jgi:flagellar basal body-associated protein FliL